ncbi:GntR family transcriptional regulator [Spirochaetia bacterium]|nr:GntR family transcriptional regulator [Spirochaetia bacterium]
MSNMVKSLRHKNIMEMLNSKGAVSISEIAASFGASMMTIRRDIDILEKNGQVCKMHGFATLAGETAQPPFQERAGEFTEEKNRIGRAAAAMIKKDSIVMFDAGTSTLAITQYIPEDLEFTAVTTGLMTAAALCNCKKANIICIGGNIHHSSYSVINYMGIEMLSRFRADLAFISTKAISLPEGLFEMYLPLIEIKKAIVSHSDKIVLLADHSKFSAKALCLSVPLQDISLVITDDGLPENVLKKLAEMGKEYLVAPGTA